MDFAFSPYGRASTLPSPVGHMMAAFATEFRDGIDINLGVGYVNERTIPDTLLVEALAAVAGNPAVYRQAFNYGGPAGSANLTGALNRFYLAHRVGGLGTRHLEGLRFIVGPSGATSLLEGVAAVLLPGIVVTADPMYYIYCNFLERCGYRVVTVPEDREGVDPDRLEAVLRQMGQESRNLAFFYFVTVNNPTSTVLSNARRRRLAGIAARVSREQNRLIPIIFDQAYEFLMHDPALPRPESVLPLDELGTVFELGTLSKILAPALRIGYMLGRPGPLLDALVQHTNDVGFSAPLAAQEMAAWLLDHHIAGQIAQVNAGYRAKARAVRAAIERELGPYLEGYTGGQAGFYFYLTFKHIETHTRSPFFRHLTRTTGNPAFDGSADSPLPRVVYIPGEYCVHPKGTSWAQGQRQLRLSYGFEEPERIATALRLMREAAERCR